jgi:hypothetical protein
MNPRSEINDNNKKDRTKATAAIPMMGAIVTAALLLSGLSLISSYQQPVIAQQQNMTGGAGGNATTAGVNATTAGVNATTGVNQTTLEVRMHLEEVRTALQNDDTETALLHLDLALNALGGNMTTTAGVVGEEVVVEEGEEGGGEEVVVEEGEEGGGEGEGGEEEG